MIKKIIANILLNNFKRIFYVLIKSKYEFLSPGYINFVLKKKHLWEIKGKISNYFLIK